MKQQAPHPGVVKRQQELEREREAFALVFGREGKRTADQEIVWAALERLGGLHEPVFRLPAAGAPVDALSAAYRDGARGMVLALRERVTFKPSQEKHE